MQEVTQEINPEELAAPELDTQEQAPASEPVDTKMENLKKAFEERKAKIREAFYQKYKADLDPQNPEATENLCKVAADISAAYVELAESVGNISAILGNMVRKNRQG